MFRICWKSKATGFQSQGNFIFKNGDDALEEIKRTSAADVRNGFGGVFIYWIESQEEVAENESTEACISDKARP